VKTRLIQWLGLDEQLILIHAQLEQLQKDRNRLFDLAGELRHSVDEEKEAARQNHARKVPWPMRRAFLEATDGGRRR
jgi:hypothetical protein